MKNVLKWSFVVLFIIAMTTTEGTIDAQTSGTFTLSLNTTSTGGYSPEHLLAIWIENSTPAFVKTRLRRSQNGDLVHLGLWTSRTNSNIVDAITGASLATHGNVTVTWNGTNVTGTVVPDGAYSVWVEMAWGDNLTTGKTYSIFPFTKGTSAFQSNPSNLTNFTNISLTWTPGSPTGVENVTANSEVSVYPNPSSGLLNVKFRNGHKVVLVNVFNEAGVSMLREKFYDLSAGEKTIDISGFPSGAYLVNFKFENGDETVRVVKTK